MALSAEMKRIKSNCWGAMWRPCAWNHRTGLPTHYVRLTETELAQFLALGELNLPDSQLPTAAIAQRNVQRDLERAHGEVKLGLRESVELAVEQVRKAVPA